MNLNEITMFAINIAKVELKLKNMPKIVFGHNNEYNSDDNIICLSEKQVIARSDDVGGDLRSVICHELRHAWQIETGILVGIGNMMAIWKDKIMMKQVNTQAEHEALPWEKDAIKFEQAMCKKYKLAVRKTAEVSEAG